MNRKKNTKEYTEYEKRLIKYYQKCFISEFSKICVFFIIFMFLDVLPEYMIALLTLITLRSNSGGLHYKHYLSCFIVSFLFLYCSIFLSKYVMPPKSILFISTLLCALIGYTLTPITSSQRPPATDSQIKKCKRNTTIVILFFFLLICICPQVSYIYICYWTVILHILQLIVAHIKEVKKNVQLGTEI